MKLEQAIREHEETIAAGNWAFVQCCFETAIRQAKESAVAEQVCIMCDHPRRQHSFQGCTHGDKNYGRCICTVKYMDKSSFREKK